MQSQDKRAELLKLAKLRQATRWPGYNCIGDYHGGAYECEFVSPYTKTAGNVDAEVLVLLQDWSSDESLKEPLCAETAKLGHTPHLLTNRNLTRLLNQTFGLQLSDIYATNLFPFVKRGGMSASISQTDLIEAAKQFALLEIRIVNPKLVICLGLVTFNALRQASGLAPCYPMDLAIKSPFNIGRSRVWCQAHTGALGQNNRNRGRVDRVTADWLRMKDDL